MVTTERTGFSSGSRFLTTSGGLPVKRDHCYFGWMVDGRPWARGRKQDGMAWQGMSNCKHATTNYLLDIFSLSFLLSCFFFSFFSPSFSSFFNSYNLVVGWMGGLQYSVKRIGGWNCEAF